MNDLTDQHAAATPDLPLPQAETRFMIVAQARSGSTVLREALNAEPDIICHGEAFSRVWIDRLVPRPGSAALDGTQIRALLPGRDADPLRFMADYVMPFPGMVTGFKIIYDDLIDPRFLDKLTGYARQNGLRIIHLRRLNPVAALASRTRMSRFGLAHSDMARRRPDAPAPEAFAIPLPELQQYIRRQQALADRVDGLFPDALQIRYESLGADYPRVLAHLGLSGERPFIAPLRKMAPQDLASVIQNYDEIRDYDRPAQPLW